MRPSRLRQRRQAKCDHRDVIATVTAGITRSICESCGHVGVGHHHDLVEIGAEEGLPMLIGRAV